MAEEAKDVLELEVDPVLVKDATEKVMGLIDDKHKNSIEIGRCLIENFYNNDYERAREGRKVKGKSLNKMLNDLQKLQNTPSKSWFYNTINLAVDDKAFKGNPDYAKLNLSQKIWLTYLNKDKEWEPHKLELISEISQKGMSISKLKDRISEIKGQQAIELPSVEVFRGMDDEDKRKCTRNAQDRQKKLQKAIDKLKAKLAKQEAELAVCEEIINVAEMPAEQSGVKTDEQPQGEPGGQADAKLPDEQLVSQTDEQSFEQNDEQLLRSGTDG